MFLSSNMKLLYFHPIDCIVLCWGTPVKMETALVGIAMNFDLSSSYDIVESVNLSILSGKGDSWLFF